MDPSEFHGWCRRGEELDALLWDGRPREAVPQYRAMLEAMVNTGRVDAFLVSKATLGLLYALVGARDYSAAHGVWLGKRPKEAEMWVGLLEMRQMSGPDIACYHLVSAFLFSLSAGDREQALSGVEQNLSPVLAFARETNDVQLGSAAASNWALHLNEICEGAVPEELTLRLHERIEEVGLQGDFWSKELWLPKLQPWRVDWNAGGKITSYGPGREPEVEPDPAMRKPPRA